MPRRDVPRLVRIRLDVVELHAVHETPARRHHCALSPYHWILDALRVRDEDSIRPASAVGSRSILADAYRGERAIPAIQCVIGQKPRCIFDDRDEAFPYSLEHLIDRLVGQQTVLPYRYVHLLCPFLSVSQGRSTDTLALPLLSLTALHVDPDLAVGAQADAEVNSCRNRR